MSFKSCKSCFTEDSAMLSPQKQAHDSIAASGASTNVLGAHAHFDPAENFITLRAMLYKVTIKRKPKLFLKLYCLSVFIILIHNSFAL